jgi:hypothetical protein
VLVLPYEQFVADGRGFVEAIARFAGREIPADEIGGLPFDVRSNKAQSALAVEVARPLNRFRRRKRPEPGAAARVSPALEGRGPDQTRGSARLSGDAEARDAQRAAPARGRRGGDRHALRRR